MLVIFDYEKQIIVQEIEIKRDPSFFDVNFDLFVNFFLDWIFYDNSSLRSVGAGVRKVVNKKLRTLLTSQMNKNSENLTSGLSFSLENHFLREKVKIFKQQVDQNAMNSQTENFSANNFYSEKDSESIEDQDKKLFSLVPK